MRTVHDITSSHPAIDPAAVNTADSRRFILLGPQQGDRSLIPVLRSYGYRGPVGLITAGWEEDESDDDALRVQLNRPVSNLRLFERAEKLFSRDADLFELLRQRQDRLRELRDVYRMRLGLALQAARQMLRDAEHHPRLQTECESAIEIVRVLDREYAERTGQVCGEFESRMETSRRPRVIKHRKEIAEMLQHVDALLIAGGHVAVLLDRLKIFGLPEICPLLPVVAWSGGVMALSERIVLFHDHPAQGPGDAEILRAGLGCIKNIVPLPHAHQRLNLDDRVRVALMARRFHPSVCLVMEPQTHLCWHAGQWYSNTIAYQLGTDGQLTEYLPRCNSQLTNC